MIVSQQTTNFIVTYDDSINPANGYTVNGSDLAQAVLNYCEYDLVRFQMLFNGVTLNLPITVNLTPSTTQFGAQNDGFNIITGFINPSPATYDTHWYEGLVVAELAEIFMVAQGRGWVAGWSNGEALSRVSGALLYPNLAGNFSNNYGAMNPTSWINQNPRPDWVDNVEPTDQHIISIGCGTLFLNYLAYQLNYGWADIYGAGAPTTHTLNETATILGVTNAYNNFAALMAANYPVGVGAGLPDDIPFPLGAPAPGTLYLRHNLADNGTSHTGSLSDSPDIIVKNNPVANPQATYSTPASIASDTESDPDVLTGQPNYVYLRVWNRGTAATNVFASVYYAPPATLVTPDQWTLIGTAYYPAVPGGSVVQVANPGVLWPANQIPAPGHYCFVAMVGGPHVATVGSVLDPSPNPPAFGSFNDFVDYIYANNNITWRNFNVVANTPMPIRNRFPGFVVLPFRVAGAFDQAHLFGLETVAELPPGSHLELETAEWLGRGLKPAPKEVTEFKDPETDPKFPSRVRFPLLPKGGHALGEIELPIRTSAPSHLLVHIPEAHRHQAHTVVIRQLYRGREVGRITWRLVPEK